MAEQDTSETTSSERVAHHKAKLVADVDTRFTYHPPKGDQLERYQQLRDKAKELALLIVELTPISREQSAALTHLETASMFANAAIARHE